MYFAEGIVIDWFEDLNHNFLVNNHLITARVHELGSIAMVAMSMKQELDAKLKLLLTNYLVV